MYVCGITPYDSTHLGHAATYLTYDLLIRRLEELGHEVRMVRNVTDVDDSILPKARELGVPYLELAEAELARFRSDMDALDTRPPLAEPRATESIDGMIEHGRRAARRRPRLRSARHRLLRRVDVPALRRAVALLARRDGAPRRASAAATPTTRTVATRSTSCCGSRRCPTSRRGTRRSASGRPGWHVECSVMAMHELGPTIDLHGGGTDLIFPHHECEVAQSESITGEPFSRHWVHSAMVSYEGEKMSKSLGNLVFVSDLLKTADARAIRLALMQHHYRAGFEWHDTDLDDGTALLHRLLAAAERPDGADPRPYADARARRHRPRPRRPARARGARRPRQRGALRRQRHHRAGGAARARRAARHRPRPAAQRASLRSARKRLRSAANGHW